ncbi:MAG: DUF1440 domain-containing protein [Chloroflexi bacterium]|nr:DUF1440 domain-containing protein [Chloroflexota bacterium]
MTAVQDVAARVAEQVGGKTTGWRPTGWSLRRRGGRFELMTPAGEYELRSPVGPPQDTPLMIIAKGALAGLAGTAVITIMMQGIRALLEPQEGERGQYEAMPPQMETRRTEPTEEMVQRVATGVAETRITPEQRQMLGTALHWMYGSFWGMLYGLVQTTLHLPAAFHGALLGMTVWGVGPLSLFPAMKLTPPPTEQTMTRTLLSGVAHLVYGWVTAYTFRLLSRDPRV